MMTEMTAVLAKTIDSVGYALGQLVVAVAALAAGAILLHVAATIFWNARYRAEFIHNRRMEKSKDGV